MADSFLIRGGSRLKGKIEISGSKNSALPILAAVLTADEGRTTLRAYLWPDQVERRERLEGALQVAASVPATVDRADLGAWAEARLAEPVPGVATVIVHSIVWQYVPRASRDRLRAALRDAGARATPDAPLAWLRMEPAGPVADLRLTSWPGGDEVVLGTAGYHGVPVHWGARPG